MDVYYMAGSAADPEFAEAELLGDLLIKTHPRVEVVSDMRNPCEWIDFRGKITQSRGFTSPGVKALVWRRDGRLIGGVREFAALLKDTYNMELNADKELIKRITQENMETVEQAAADDAWTPSMGQYRKEWQDGNIFEGSWQAHRPHRGTVTFPDGSTYEGALRHGLFQGMGLRKYANGSKFQGMFQKGKRQGKGRFDDGAGNVYEGSYAENQPHGKGRRSWPDGRVYNGDWEGGQATGVAVEKRPRKGKEGEADEYDGQFVEGIRQGAGKMTYHEGHVYAGEWAGGLKNGKGTFTWKESKEDEQEARFEGTFVKGVPIYGKVAFGETGISVAYPGEIPRVNVEKEKGWVVPLAKAARTWWKGNSERKPREKEVPYTEFPFNGNTAPTVCSENLTKEMWDGMFGRITAGKMRIYHCVAPTVAPKKRGVQVIPPGLPDFGRVGVLAADEHCYVVFRELFDPVVKDLHRGYDPVGETHPTNLDPTKVNNEGPDHAMVVGCRITARRSLGGVAAAATCMTLDEKAEVEAVAVKALQALKKTEPWAAGQYYPMLGSDTYAEKMGGCTEEETEALKADGVLFDQSHCFDTRDFVQGRGVWRTKDKQLHVLINKEEHAEFVSQGSSLHTCFTNLSKALLGTDKSLKADKKHPSQWAHSPALGFLTSCPATCGTGMVVQVTVKAPKLSKRPDLAALAAKAGLSLLENEAVKGDQVTMLCPSLLGTSEVDVVNKVLDGVAFLSKYEKMLAGGRGALWLWDDHPKVCVTGPPTCDKRAVAKAVAHEFGSVLVSASGLLKEQVEAKTEVGITAAKMMDDGYLLPPDVMAGLVRDRLARADCAARGWVLEGFPRTAGQAEELHKHGVAPNKVVVLNIKESLVAGRCTGRKWDPLTGEPYHEAYRPAPLEDEEVAFRLAARPDDANPKAVTLRAGQNRSNAPALWEAVKEVGKLIEDTGVVGDSGNRMDAVAYVREAPPIVVKQAPPAEQAAP